MAMNTAHQVATLCEILTGERNPLMDFRTVDERADAKAKIAAWRRSPKDARGPIRFNYRGRPSDLLPALCRKNEAGFACYYQANRTDGNGRKLANMVAARMVALDLDGAPLPTKWRVQPHLIVESSRRKYQCIWAIRETKDFARHKNIMLRLAQRYGGDRSVADVTRVFRLPGFLHQKGKPFRSRIIQQVDPADALDRYRLSNFEWLPEIPKPTPKVVRASGGTISRELAARYFAHLPASEFSHGNYDNWLRIGMAMHFATGGEAADEWLAWCASDPEFDSDEDQETAAAKWEGFDHDREGGVTIGTLVHFGEMHGVPSRILGKIKFGPISAAEDFNDGIEFTEA